MFFPSGNIVHRPALCHVPASAHLLRPEENARPREQLARERRRIRHRSGPHGSHHLLLRGRQLGGQLVVGLGGLGGLGELVGRRLVTH